ncbi:MAG: hypothetical protein HUJ22_12885 [Gracilimonas sp.]|uniref:hypothetical protein n=1 Tax=Gracilimonas sp. TaxID=1974203 RepID=UPI001990198F|nr:hypothetical protein [Gracilimonas sp.]MBD3617457.1 hypothetical protein [Gracilimonas sp.]
MEKNKAKLLARQFLSKNIQLEVLSETPSGISIYPKIQENEFLVRFTLFAETHGFGADQYVAVSKKDGTVRYVGYHGE